MERVEYFIDGFNLYHALDDLRAPHLKWVDLAQLAQTFLQKHSQRLVGVYYFSAYARWRPEGMKRHCEYVAALEARNVTCVMGHFKVKDRRCPKCKFKWSGHEEKESDVNIALALLRGAYKDTYDHAYIISRDSDLVPAVRMVLTEFPKKRITIVAPPHKGHSTDLIKAATGKAKLRRIHIERCLLPAEVRNAAGEVVATRPAAYAPPAEMVDTP